MMPRILASFFTTCALTALCALSACSGSGGALNTGKPSTTGIVITSGGQVNVARVLAGSGIALSAVATSGSQNGAIGNNKFIWHATLVNGASYASDQAGGTKPCASVTVGNAAAGPFAPYAPDYSAAVAIDPVNEANIIFIPPLTIPYAAGTFPGPLNTATAYCAIVTATQGGVTGSIVVAIVDPQFPLQ